ncbi:MAG: M48 family metalloprotease [Phycisphaerales bacterium]|nr:M48 family metalloprotease [Phycisphaerales bacterium]
MIDGVVLSVLIAIALHDGLADAMSAPPLARGAAAAVWLGGYALLAAAVFLWVTLCTKQLDHTGRLRWVHRAELGVRFARLGIVAHHVVAIFILHVLELTRETLGNPVLLDEAFVAAPPIVVLLATHAAWYPMDRRLRESVLMRQLDEGEPIVSMPTRGGYLIDQMRHRILTVLAPVTIISGWSEGMEHVAKRQAWSAGLEATLQYAGVLLAIVIMPLLVRYIWATRRLGAGPLRARLDDMCQEQRIKCNDLLVWRTHGGMINGALIGLIAPLRFVLLTDGLLDRLPTHQVEAVMAHELAHARKNHLPWLLASMLLVTSVSWVGFGWLAGVGLGAQSESVMGLLAVPPTVLASIAWFGFVSRRFEWQADACAAQHLAGWTAATRSQRMTPPTIDPASAEAMAGALGSVARLNNVHLRRRSFRHGSIAVRQQHLRAIVGVLATRLPIDRTVNIIKGVTALGLLTTGMWIVLGLVTI